jgi:hypothetical protein
MLLLLVSRDSSSLDVLAEQYFNGSGHPTHTPALPLAPSLLGPGYATAGGRPNLGVGPYPHPGIAFDHAVRLDRLTGVVLPPHAEPSLITDCDGDGVPDQSERLESFEFVSTPSISAVNGGGNDHIDAHAWWTDFAGLAPMVSQTLSVQSNSSKNKGKSKSNFSWSGSVKRLVSAN